MPLTPADVANKLFGKQVRGYAMDEVDAFLDDVEQELTRLLSENSRLSQRLSQMGAGGPAAAPTPVAAPAAPAPSAPPVAPVGDVAETQEAALRTLLMAQKAADQAVAEAREEADKLLAVARDSATRSEQEMNARVAQALGRLEQDKKDLEQRIDELRAFEREYRVRLKAYLEGQLKELESRGGEGAGAGVPSAARSAAVGETPRGVTDPGAARPAAPPAAPPAPPRPAFQPAPPPPAPARPAGAPAPPPPAPSVAPSRPASPGVAPPPPAPPAGPPRQAPGAPDPAPFVIAPHQVEQIDEGPEPPARS